MASASVCKPRRLNRETNEKRLELWGVPEARSGEEGATAPLFNEYSAGKKFTYKIGAEAAFEYCPPEGTEPVFDPEAMQDIHQWITTEASNMIFIYGKVDPWSASAVQLTGGPTP